MNQRIGIDIGDIFTNAVLVDKDDRIVRSVKVCTTPDVVTGFHQALEQLISTKTQEFFLKYADSSSSIFPFKPNFLIMNKRALYKHVEDMGPVLAVFIGTTLSLTSILTSKHIKPVGLIRLAGYYPDSVPAAFGWPSPLREQVFVGEQTVSGGFECDAREITPLNYEETMAAAQFLIEKGAQSLVVNGIFSCLYNDQELQVKDWIEEKFKIPVLASHEIGGSSFIDRENASLFNQSIYQVANYCFTYIKEIVMSLLGCGIYIVNNSGVLLNSDEALKYPIKIIFSGPSNSLTGSAHLAKMSDAVVVNISSSSTNIGHVVNFNSVRIPQNLNFENVIFSFNASCLELIPIGVSSIIDEFGNIGPKSLGNDFFKSSFAFGGNVATLTDAAISYGMFSSSDFRHLASPDSKPFRKAFSKKEAEKILKLALSKIISSNHILKENSKIILTSELGNIFPSHLLNDNFIIPPFDDIASAYGVAMAHASYTLDQIVTFVHGRKHVMELLIKETLSQARLRGVINPQIAEKQILPYHYIPGHLARVIITAKGSFHFQ